VREQNRTELRLRFLSKRRRTGSKERRFALGHSWKESVLSAHTLNPSNMRLCHRNICSASVPDTTEARKTSSEVQFHCSTRIQWTQSLLMWERGRVTDRLQPKQQRESEVPYQQTESESEFAYCYSTIGKTSRNYMECKIRGFHSGEHEECRLLERVAAYALRKPTFRKILLSPFSA
jgi:hypothetical protein